MPDVESPNEAHSEFTGRVVELRQQFEQLKSLLGQQGEPPSDLSGKLAHVQLIFGNKLAPQGSSRERIARAILSFQNRRTKSQLPDALTPREQFLNLVNQRVQEIGDYAVFAHDRIDTLEKQLDQEIYRRNRLEEVLSRASRFVNFHPQETKGYEGEPSTLAVAFYRCKDPRHPGNEFAHAALKRPLFPAYRCPSVPLEPMDPSIPWQSKIEEHSELARFHGLTAFAVDFYWHPRINFANPTLGMIANSDKFRIKFCLNWRSDEPGKISEDELCWLYSSYKTYASSANYLTIDNRPLLLIESAAPPSNFTSTVEGIKRLSKADDLVEPYVIIASLSPCSATTAKEFGFDGFTQLRMHQLLSDDQPTMMYLDNPSLLRGLHLNPNFKVLSYSGIAGHFLRALQTPTSAYQTVYTSYDGHELGIRIGYAFSKPEAFQAWLQRACSSTFEEFGPEYPFVFIKSWNDWNSGCHLLPDIRTGYANLAAVNISVERADAVHALQSETAKQQALKFHEEGLAEWRDNLARYIKNHPGQNPIIIYQIGKVGSSSVIKAMRDCIPKEPILGMHNLANLKEGIVHALAHLPDPSEAMEVLHQGMAITEWMATLSDDIKLSVITMVKDPISRNISHFFHAIGSFWPDFKHRFEVGDIDMEEVRDTFLGLFLSFKFEEWFRQNFEPIFPIDVSTISFDHDKGFAIAEPPNARYRVMVMRSDDISRVLTPACKEFIGADVTLAARANTAEEKFYSTVYREFKKLPLPSWYVANMLDDAVIRNYYSKSEIEGMYSKYTLGS